MDSTTITLFKQILKGAGRNPKRGKKKGGMKVHTLIASDENTPKLAIMSSSATHDHIMLKKLELPQGSFIVFDSVVEYLTNNFELSPNEIFEIYRRRWQIETLFRQMKQNFQLKYFLGDNVNAIECQVWVAMIANLLQSIIKSGVKRVCSYTGIVSLIRLQLLSYISLYDMLEKPENRGLIC